MVVWMYRVRWWAWVRRRRFITHSANAHPCLTLVLHTCSMIGHGSKPRASSRQPHRAPACISKLDTSKRPYHTPLAIRRRANRCRYPLPTRRTLLTKPCFGSPKSCCLPDKPETRYCRYFSSRCCRYIFVNPCVGVSSRNQAVFLGRPWR